jgi:hypothetical protein
MSSTKYQTNLGKKLGNCMSDFDPIECGDIQQMVICEKCGRKWINVFRLIEVVEIATGHEKLNISEKEKQIKKLLTRQQMIQNEIDKLQTESLDDI